MLLQRLMADYPELNQQEEEEGGEKWFHSVLNEIITKLLEAFDNDDYEVEQIVGAISMDDYRNKTYYEQESDLPWVMSNVDNNENISEDLKKHVKQIIDTANQ